MGVKSKEGRIGSGPNCSHWFWASLSVALGSLSVSVSVCLCVCVSLSAGVLGVWVWVSIHSSPSSPSPSPLPFIISSFVSHVSTTTLIPISLFVFLPSLSLSTPTPRSNRIDYESFQSVINARNGRSVLFTHVRIILPFLMACRLWIVSHQHFPPSLLEQTRGLLIRISSRPLFSPPSLITLGTRLINLIAFFTFFPISSSPVAYVRPQRCRDIFRKRP